MKKERDPGEREKREREREKRRWLMVKEKEKERGEARVGVCVSPTATLDASTVGMICMSFFLLRTASTILYSNYPAASTGRTILFPCILPHILHIPWFVPSSDPSRPSDGKSIAHPRGAHSDILECWLASRNPSLL